ncbi:hypothetical protein B5P20_14460 [Clavibacter sepedonicus]|nr:hypothetical protein B5P20_14460 [Clavibacter sepedonicus]
MDGQYGCWLTPAELGQLRQRTEDLLLSRHRERRTDAGSRPPSALPVELLVRGRPIRTAP